MNFLTRRQFPDVAEKLATEGVPTLLARLYAARGVVSSKEVAGSLADLLSPDLLLNADLAAEMLADALESDAKIVIVADYDCDGATACALSVQALRAFSQSLFGRQNVHYYVPNRFTQGYGLSADIVDVLAEDAPDLIMTVDNGIASVSGVQRAKEYGISTLITDHHLPPEVLPDADCIVNPNQKDCPFPSKHLSGVGVVFYLMLALRKIFRERGAFADLKEPNLAQYLDLVALGTVADVAVLDANNRILVAEGLARMRAGRASFGIQALFRIGRRETQKAAVFDLGFVVGPRLNAAGRLSDMRVGIACLMSEDENTALALAQSLDTLNQERKEIEKEMQEEALHVLAQIKPTDGASLALFDESWHQGVIGILASRLKDRYHRPVFLFAKSDDTGEIKGSGRSIEGFHLKDALDAMAQEDESLFLRFGGHAMAAGAAILEANFPRFQSLFEKVAAARLSKEALQKTHMTDGSLETGFMTLQTAKTLSAQIWGQGFPAPLFVDAFVVTSQKILKEKHLKLTLLKDGQTFSAIWFNFQKTPSAKIRALYRLETNSFNGIESVQLVIEDLKTED